eukprot:457369-Hanusia_phi.AAC.3
MLGRCRAPEEESRHVHHDMRGLTPPLVDPLNYYKRAPPVNPCRRRVVPSGVPLTTPSDTVPTLQIHTTPLPPLHPFRPPPAGTRPPIDPIYPTPTHVHAPCWRHSTVPLDLPVKLTLPYDPTP